MYIFSNFIVQRVKVRTITCPNQLTTRGDATVSVAKVVLPPLTQLSAYVSR